MTKGISTSLVIRIIAFFLIAGAILYFVAQQQPQGESPKEVDNIDTQELRIEELETGTGTGAEGGRP